MKHLIIVIIALLLWLMIDQTLSAQVSVSIKTNVSLVLRRISNDFSGSSFEMEKIDVISNH